MIRHRVLLRSCLSLIAVVAIMWAAVQPMVAVNEATGSGGIQVRNTGSLEVTFGSGEIEFVTEAGGPALITSASGDVTYAQIPLTINDGRAEGARHPFSISMYVSSPTTESTSYKIDSTNIVFIAVEGLPAGLSQGWTSGLVSPAGEEAIVISGVAAPSEQPLQVIVHLRMSIPAGTVPGTYTGKVFFTVNTNTGLA